VLLRNTLDHGTPVGVAAKHQWEVRQNIIGSFSATPLGIPSGYQGVFFWNITGSPLDPRTVLGRLWPLFRASFFCYHGLLCPFVRRSVRPPSPHPPPSLAFPCPIRRQAPAPMGRLGRLEPPRGGTMTLAVCVAAAWLALAGFARAGTTTTTVPEELCIYECVFPFLLLVPSTSPPLLFFMLGGSAV